MSGPVGGGDQNDAGPLAEAVHLDQQLVERLFTLVMSTAETCTTLTADGVDLVDEDDARRIPASPVRTDREHARRRRRRTSRRNPEPEIVKNGTPAPPATARASNVLLPVPGGPNKKHTLRGSSRRAPDSARRILQEVLDLVELLDGLVHTRHIGERRLRHVLD